MTLRSQIATVRDATEFLTGQWATKPAEVGFTYNAKDLDGISRNHILSMAQKLADEIDSQRAKAKSELSQ